MILEIRLSGWNLKDLQQNGRKAEKRYGGQNKEGFKEIIP